MLILHPVCVLNDLNGELFAGPGEIADLLGHLDEGPVIQLAEAWYYSACFEPLSQLVTGQV